MASSLSNLVNDLAERNDLSKVNVRIWIVIKYRKRIKLNINSVNAELNIQTLKLI